MTDLRDQPPAFEAAALRLLHVPAATCHPGRPEWAWHRCRECFPAAREARYQRYDEVLVERVIAGRHHGPVGVVNAAEVVRRMAARGYSDGQIGHALGRSDRSVLRVRHRHGIPAALPGGGANQHSWRHPAPSRHWRTAS